MSLGSPVSQVVTVLSVVGSATVLYADKLPNWILGVLVPVGLIGLFFWVRIKNLERNLQCRLWWTDDDPWWMDDEASKKH